MDERAVRDTVLAAQRYATAKRCNMATAEVFERLYNGLLGPCLLAKVCAALALEKFDTELALAMAEGQPEQVRHEIEGNATIVTEEIFEKHQMHPAQFVLDSREAFGIRMAELLGLETYIDAESIIEATVVIDRPGITPDYIRDDGFTF